MTDIKIIELYLDRKRRFAQTEEELNKVKAIKNLIKYSDWLDHISKEAYVNAMTFIGLKEKQINEYYDNYMQKKASFLDTYTNIFPEDLSNKSKNNM